MFLNYSFCLSHTVNELKPVINKHKICIYILCTPLLYNYYVFHDRVTLFFADNFSKECRITIEILHNFFLDPEVFFSSHTMFINAATKEFTLVNNAFPSHHVAFEHLLNYKMVANVY